MKSPVVNLSELRDRLFNAYQVAEILGLCVDSVRRRIREGYLPARSVPGDNAFVISGNDLITYLQGVPVSTKRKLRQVPKGLTEKGSPELAVSTYKLSPEVSIRLRAWIEQNSLQLKQVAEQTGIHASELSRIVRQERSLTRPNAERLRKGLGDEVFTYLLTGETRAKA